MENFDDKYKKKNPFTVPEGYFDELTGRITGRIEKQKEVKKSSSLRGLKPYMGLVAIFFLALMVFRFYFPERRILTCRISRGKMLLYRKWNQRIFSTASLIRQMKKSSNTWLLK